MGSDLWALPALGTGHRLGMRCTKSACALRLRGAADPHSTQIEDHVTLNRLHLEHLECSHKPHTQGRGSKKRPRAGCWAAQLTRLFTSRNPAEPDDHGVHFSRDGELVERFSASTATAAAATAGRALLRLRKARSCRRWSVAGRRRGGQWCARAGARDTGGKLTLPFTSPSWLYHSPHTSGELLLLSFSSPC